MELWGGLLSLPRLGILWDPGEAGIETLQEAGRTLPGRLGCMKERTLEKGELNKLRVNKGRGKHCKV